MGMINRCSPWYYPSSPHPTDPTFPAFVSKEGREGGREGGRVPTADPLSIKPIVGVHIGTPTSGGAEYCSSKLVRAVELPYSSLTLLH